MIAGDTKKLKLILKSLEIKLSFLTQQIKNITDSIHKIEENITRLTDYAKPYKDYVYAADAMHSHFLKNNDVFLEKISNAIVAAKIEKEKLEKFKKEAASRYRILTKKIDGLSNLIDAILKSKLLLQEDLDDMDQLDRFNANQYLDKQKGFVSDSFENLE